MGRSIKVWKLWGSILLVGVIMWLLQVAALGNQRGEAKMEEIMQMEKTNFHRKMDIINFISKRRVPNGSDPIHNRKAGNSRQPPGQAYAGEFNRP